VFTRMNEAPAPVTPAPVTPAPVTPAPEPTPEPTPNPEPVTPKPEMPTEFPPMPKVSLPPQNLNIDGVWGAYVDGKQFITQYQGKNYYGWIDGQPSEMGIITIKGKTLSGRNNNGVEFTAELELSEDGKELSLTFENGNTIRYQKLQ
ncbi:MAG: hypothetical protein IJQ08_04600, partial [Synergistaceae bacterium]|nr:hypothetical protein [Synergistaceae bacterium]